MIYLDLDRLLTVAASITEPLVRDYGLLESALARPQSTVFGSDAYPDLHTKAAALLASLVTNYALVDGNKRLGWAACAVFLGLNARRVRADQAAIVELVVAVADGSLRDVEKIADRLRVLTD